MFYFHNLNKWLTEVVNTINTKKLQPEECTFMIAFVHSMHIGFPRYFSTNFDEIASYSGEGFHIYLPFIDNEDLVNVQYFDYIVKEFRGMGFEFGYSPCFVFFKLIKENKKFIPKFFAKFEYRLPFNSHDFNSKLIEVINLCKRQNDLNSLGNELQTIFGEHNNINRESKLSNFRDAVTEKIPQSKIFISYSSNDREFVNKLLGDLKENDGNFNFWIDHTEIGAGDTIPEKISEGLRDSNILILVVSESSIQSPWVLHEVSSFATNLHNRKIIPILLHATAHFPEPVNGIISDRKYLDFSTQDLGSNNIMELLKAINV